MKFIFYQNMLSIHQHALLTALAKRYEVTLVAEQKNLSFRAATGWDVPEFEGCHVVISPDEATLRKFVGITDAVHIFSGITAFPMVKRALEYSLAKDVPRLAFMEPLSPLGWRAPLRRWGYRLSASRRNRTISGFLCTGKVGVECFRSVGYAPEKIFEFGYFTEPPAGSAVGECEDAVDLPSVVFVGSLDRRKNVLALAKVLVDLRDEFVTGDFIGRGIFQDRLLKIIGDTPNIRYLGSVDNSQIGEIMSKHDILVLPSLFDGWGAVVNEALQCGCRVVVSDECGAASLIENSARGTVYSNREANGLKRALQWEFRRGRSTCDMRHKIRDWCNSCISGAAAAAYLVQIVECVANGGERPLPPWRRK